MTEPERDALIEQGVTAYRERDREGRPVPMPAWWDLAPEDLDELYRRQVAQRAMERALDPRGRGGTVLAVLLRI